MNLFAIYIPPDVEASVAIELLENFGEKCTGTHADSAISLQSSWNNICLSTHGRIVSLIYAIDEAYKLYKLLPMGNSYHCAI